MQTHVSQITVQRGSVCDDFIRCPGNRAHGPLDENMQADDPFSKFLREQNGGAGASSTPGRQKDDGNGGGKGVVGDDEASATAHDKPDPEEEMVRSLLARFVHDVMGHPLYSRRCRPAFDLYSICKKAQFHSNMREGYLCASVWLSTPRAVLAPTMMSPANGRHGYPSSASQEVIAVSSRPFEPPTTSSPSNDPCWCLAPFPLRATQPLALWRLPCPMSDVGSLVSRLAGSCSAAPQTGRRSAVVQPRATSWCPSACPSPSGLGASLPAPRRSTAFASTSTEG